MAGAGSAFGAAAGARAGAAVGLWGMAVEAGLGGLTEYLAGTSPFKVAV